MKPDIFRIDTPFLLSRAETMVERSAFVRIRTNPRTGHKFLVFDHVPTDQPFIMRRRHILRLFGVSEVYGWVVQASTREAFIWLTEDEAEQPTMKKF